MLLFGGGARGAFFALLASFVLLAITIPQFFSRLWFFFLSTMAVGSSLSLLLPMPHPAYGLLRRILKTIGSETLNGASTGRIKIWADAFEIFLERPLFGHGLVQYQHLTDKLTSATPEHVHNILFEALISFGLIGTMTLIYLIGKILVSSARQMRSRQSDSDIPMFFVATTLLIHGFVSGTYFHMHSMITIAIALGLLLHTQLKRS
jgi:O-antigen ligase